MFRKRLPIILLITIFFSAINMVAPYFFGDSVFVTLTIVICLALIFIEHRRGNLGYQKINFFYLLIFFYSSILLCINYSLANTTEFMFTQYGNFFRLIIVLLVLNYANIKLKDYLLGIRIGVLLGALSIIVFSQLKIDVVLLANDFSADYQTRFSGFYLNANYGGVILALVYNLFKDKEYKISLIETLILFTAIFYTFSFTAIIVLLIGLYKKNKPLFVVIPILSLAYLITFWNTFNFSQSRYKKLAYLNDYLNGRVELNKVFTGRIELWNEGLDAIFSNPVLGNGFGYMSSSIKTFDDIGIHNSYFEIIGDFGIPLGMLIIVVLIYNLNIKKTTGLSIFVALLTGHGLLYTIPFFMIISLNHTKSKYNEFREKV